MGWNLTIKFNNDIRALSVRKGISMDTMHDTEDGAWEALRCFVNEEITEYPAVNPIPAIYDELDGDMDENGLLRAGCSRLGLKNAARYVSYDTCDYCEDCGEFFCPCTDLGNLRWEYRIREYTNTPDPFLTPYVDHLISSLSELS